MPAWFEKCTYEIGREKKQAKNCQNYEKPKWID